MFAPDTDRRRLADAIRDNYVHSRIMVLGRYRQDQADVALGGRVLWHCDDPVRHPGIHRRQHNQRRLAVLHWVIPARSRRCGAARAGASPHLGGLAVSTLMQRNPIGVSPDLSITELVEDYFYRYYFKAFPVLRGGELIGCIMAKDIRDLNPSNSAQRRVADVMRPCSPEIIVPPHLDALEALARMQGGRHSRLLVVEQGRLLGVLALSDMLQYLSLKQELDRNMQDQPWSDAKTHDATRDAGSANTCPRGLSSRRRARMTKNVCRDRSSCPSTIVGLHQIPLQRRPSKQG